MVFVHRLLSFTNLEHLLYTSDLREIKYQLCRIKFKLLKLADDIWYNKCRAFLIASSKLDLYVTLRVSFGISPYLTQCVDPKQRKAISKMRISANKPLVETERYSKGKTTREERLCPFCYKSTGEETHYLIECENEIFCNKIPYI